jgi:hypothetical protein
MLQSLIWAESANPGFGMLADESNRFLEGRRNSQRKVGLIVTVILALFKFVACDELLILALLVLVMRK